MEELVALFRQKAEAADSYVGDLPSGEAVAQMRRTVGLSQEAFARLTGVSRLAIWKFEHGHVKRSRALSRPWPRKVLTAILAEASDQRERLGRQQVLEVLAR